MTKIIESTKAQYDTLEVPFGRSYRWHQAHVVLECDCGEKLTFKMSALTGSRAVCACGADLTADIQEKLLGHQPEVQGQMLEGYEATHHPWLHDPRAQAEQNTYETKLLIPRAPPGATTTSARMVRIMNEVFNNSPLWARQLVNKTRSCRTGACWDGSFADPRETA
jgi:hypothetical protein